ncbi:MAG: GspH/FimT family pseudopilin, partial [Sedimenticolaceae bacterium]
MSSKQQGLTLVELMVTLAVAIILIAVGMPLFTGLAGSNRATTQANSLVSALKLARSEAVKRADSVTVCADNGAGACGDETDWVNGWLVHTDVNDSGGFDAGDVLRTWDPLAASSSITVAGGTEVTFFATGEANNTFS